ncbi:MAG: amidase [Acidobacteriota bacterium]|nr:amidase [Acidobacteriota bacterium]
MTRPEPLFYEPRHTPSRRELLKGVAGFAAALGLAGCGEAPAPIASRSEDLPSELWRAGAKQLAAAIAGRQVTSVEVVEAHLARIEAVNSSVNAIIALYADEAREAAADADRIVISGGPLGPLHGVPFTIKDNLDQAGKPNTNGLEENRGNIAAGDHPVVERMRAAGGVVLGRTNLPDMGLRVHSNSEIWGRTLNPWSAAHNVGGSSGGEGAALATGMTPIGLGNDIGGSLRNPANCCAIASLKPSLGRIPGTGGGMAGQLMSVDGPMARNVEDVRLGYEILAGLHAGDPWTAPVPLDLPRPSVKRVALVPEPEGGDTDSTVAQAVRTAGAALERAGFEVEEVAPPRLFDVASVWFDFLGVELAQGMDTFRQIMGEESYRFLELIFSRWESRGLEMYIRATTVRHELSVEWSEFFSRYPLVVGPVFTDPPFEVGYDIAGADEAWDVLSQLRLVVAANLLGLPAAAVPVGVGGDGLPRGVQVIADRYRDDLVLDGAAEIEAELGTFTPIDPRG